MDVDGGVGCADGIGVGAGVGEMAGIWVKTRWRRPPRRGGVWVSGRGGNDVA